MFRYRIDKQQCTIQMGLREQERERERERELSPSPSTGYVKLLVKLAN